MSERDAIALGQSIRSARETAGLSLNALAKTSGVDVAYISRLEKGQKNNPSFETRGALWARTLEHADTELGRGRQVLYDALALLDQPQALYAAAEHAEDVRRVLNAAFFHRLYVDGDKIIGGELREPFDALHEAYVIFRDSKREERSYHRTAGSPQTASSAAHPKVNGATGSTLVGSLRRTCVRGWSKTAMVGDTGIEPVTSSV